jgi:hypothetical protein
MILRRLIPNQVHRHRPRAARQAPSIHQARAHLVQMLSSQVASRQAPRIHQARAHLVEMLSSQAAALQRPPHMQRRILRLLYPLQAQYSPRVITLKNQILPHHWFTRHPAQHMLKKHIPVDTQVSCHFYRQ